MHTNRIARKFASFSIATIISAGLGVVSTILFARMYIPAEFGKTAMFTTFAHMVLMFSLLGLDQAFIRFFYDTPENQRPALAKKCMLQPVIVFSILILVSIRFWDKITDYVFSFSSFLYYLLLVIYIFLTIFFRFAQTVIRMQQRGLAYSFVILLQRISSIILTIVLFYIIGPRMHTIILGEFGSMLLSCIVSLMMSKSFWTKSSYNTERIDMAPIIAYSFPLIFTIIISAFVKSFDKIMLRSFSTFDELGAYNVAFRISLALNVIQSSFTTVWVPLAQENYSKDPGNLSLYVKTHEAMLVLFSLFMLLLISLRWIFPLFISEKYHNALLIFPLLCMQPLLYTLTETTSMGISFKKKTIYNLVSSIISFITLALPCIFLVPAFGSIGAAFGVAISYIAYFSYKTFVSNKIYPLPINYVKTVMVIGILMLMASLSVCKNIEKQVNLLSGILFLFFMLFFKNTIWNIFKSAKNIFIRKRV